MENKAHALAAGIFVAVIGALLLAMAAWLTRDTGIRHTYEISTRETVTGLQEQAPVRFRGVDVGKVSAIGFDPKIRGNVLMRIAVDRDTPLTKGTFATLSHQGVTGLAFIQLDDEGKNPVALVPDDANPPRIPLHPGLLARLEDRGEALLTRVEEVTTRVNRVLSDENQKKFTLAIDNIGQAADSATQLAKRLDHTIGKQLDPALAEAAATMRSAQKSLVEVGKTAEEFGDTARRINAKGGPIDRVSEGSDALAHAVENFNSSTLPRLNRVTEEASRSVRTLGRTLNNINENPQMLIYGTGAPRPGPGEPGFKPPEAAR